MKITTAQLRQIIKEELEKVMSEAETAYTRLSDRINNSGDLSSVKYDIENSKKLTDDERKELLQKLEKKRNSKSGEVEVPAFFPVSF